MLGDQKDELDTAPGYFEHNAPRIRCHWSRSRGLFTGSGVVEAGGADAQAWRRTAISRRMSGVKISCIASSIFPPGTTMMFGRDMNESCSIDSR